MSAVTPNTNYDTNYSNTLSTGQIISNSLTDGTATFANGTIINLQPPVSSQDAVTKGLVDGLASVAPPVNSVQYNNLTFAGSSNLTFVPNIFTVNGNIDVGNISIIGGTISGLNEPTTPSQIATKAYVDDSTSSLTNTYIQSDTGVTYTPAQMINGIIMRNLQTLGVANVSLVDTTPSATSFISYLPNATVNYSTTFKLMNNIPNVISDSIYQGKDGFTLTVTPGTGVTFYPSAPFVLNREYALSAYIVFTSLYPPAVTIIITSCGPCGANLLCAPTQSMIAASNAVAYSNYTALMIQNNLFWNLTDTINTTNNYSYTTTDIQNQISLRNPTANSTDVLGYLISPVALNQIMTIQNLSNFTITVTSQSSIWNLIPSALSIPASNQLTFSIVYNKPALSNQGSYYNIGNYNTTGGTGTGMTVVVTALETTFTITVPGSTYTQESNSYSTTNNLTTPTATGLRILIGGVNSSGGITSISTISNYLENGYQNGDIIQINGGDGTARIQLNLVNSAASFNITSLGNGEYLSTDTISISGPGTGSGAQSTFGTFMTVMSIGKFAL